MKNKILCVDDEPMILEIYKNAFGEKGYTVFTATGGTEALKILEFGDHKIDMVLLDLHLPIKSGREVLEFIRNNEKFNDLPVLIISVDGMDEIELRNMGANDFILKPFDIDEFASKIAQNLKDKSK